MIAKEKRVDKAVVEMKNRGARWEWVLMNHITEWYCDKHARSVLESRTTLLLIDVGSSGSSSTGPSIDVLQAITVLTKTLVGAEAEASWHTVLQCIVIQPSRRRRIILGVQSRRVVDNG